MWTAGCRGEKFKLPAATAASSAAAGGGGGGDDMMIVLITSDYKSRSCG